MRFGPSAKFHLSIPLDRTHGRVCCYQGMPRCSRHASLPPASGYLVVQARWEGHTSASGRYMGLTVLPLPESLLYE